MSNLKTPGVHVKEVSKLPTSVAQVETAIPAFIGYTENQIHTAGEDVIPTRISSMLEFEKVFGGAKQHQIVATEDDKGGVSVASPTVKFLMAYQMQMYFANGGGPCYIVSLGKYPTSVPSEADIVKAHKDALAVLEREDEPTLIVLTDVTNVLTGSGTEYYDAYKAALDHADKMKDRFVLVDTRESDPTKIAEFRTNITANKYGAAYFPHLKSILNVRFADTSTDKSLTVVHNPASLTNDQKNYVALKAKYATLITAINAVADADPAKATKLADLRKQGLAYFEEVQTTIKVPYDVPATIDAYNNATTKAAMVARYTEVKNALGSNADMKRTYGMSNRKALSQIKSFDNSLYTKIQAKISGFKVTLPPSAAMAGVYAKVDGSRGVWKAPANIGLNYVSSLAEKVDDEDQKTLNVHDTGKSINAIRTFRGKGTLVWGARTLDGNSNEWRYVPVRRLFNMVEESVSKAADRYVFESNDANTWTRVKAMIENYLLGLWKDGALAGASPEDAFYVSIGLGETMDAQDVLNGRMNIEIGMAAVRPAEFIVLKFSHKLQES